MDKGIARVVHPNPGGYQPGGMQMRADDNYSQQEIDSWERDEGSPWTGGYGPYPGYSEGTMQQQMWPCGR